MLGVFSVRGLGQYVGQMFFGPLCLIHQPGEFLGQHPGAIGAAGPAHLGGQPQDQPRQPGQPVQRRDGGRQVEHPSQRERRLIQGTQRRDARQQHGLPVRGA